MDTELDGITSRKAFLDYIIITGKGTIEKHEEEKEKSLTRLDEEFLSISLQKCKFGLSEIG